MNFIFTIFHEVLYRPLFNGLVFLYNVVPYHDFGIAIILLTLIIRFILYPLNQKALKSQKALSELQPQIKEIQSKYKADRVKQSQALMDFYKTKGINPASGCLPLLVQLPVLIALYQVFLNGLKPESLKSLYYFVSRPELINTKFLGLIDLSQSNYGLAILAGALTFVQSKMMAPSTKSANPGDFSTMMSRQMTYLMPIITLIIAWKLPAGLALYWVVITLFGVVQQYFVNKKINESRIAKN
ncbi:YidC/Oxa1 family membrane protein insertase [Patescibacteria group bacterium]|nr:YidC/Oxa1 family membrane protein insertase [Patescibacteria group bacterium]